MVLLTQLTFRREGASWFNVFLAGMVCGRWYYSLTPALFAEPVCCLESVETMLTGAPSNPVETCGRTCSLEEALVHSTVRSALIQGFHQPSQLTPVALATGCSPGPQTPPVSAMCHLISMFALAYFPNLSAQSSGLKLALKVPGLISLCDFAKATGLHGPWKPK